MTLGNNAYQSGQPSEYQNCYDPTWGAALSRTRPAVGNHDMVAVSGGPPPGTGYLHYFAGQLASLGPSASDPTKLYYSYDLGAWHIIVLNDTCLDGSTPNCDEAAQEQWLRNDLAGHSNLCTLAVTNRPRWSSDSLNGNKAGEGAYWNLFYQYGVDLVLDGATHHYERFALQDPDGVYEPSYGIREIISGHGGYSSVPMATQQPNSEVYDDTSYGVLKLALHQSSYDWQYLPVADGIDPAGGSFTDSGSTNCHGAPPTLTIPYRDQVLAGSPVSYWRMDDTRGTTLTDDQEVNPGTYSNVLLNQPGALAGDGNTSASFDGVRSYASVPESPSLDMSGRHGRVLGQAAHDLEQLPGAGRQARRRAVAERELRPLAVELEQVHRLLRQRRQLRRRPDAGGHRHQLALPGRHRRRLDRQDLSRRGAQASRPRRPWR